MKKESKKVANRRRQTEYRQRLRDRGLVVLHRWIYPEDLPEIDALIRKHAAARDKQ